MYECSYKKKHRYTGIYLNNNRMLLEKKYLQTIFATTKKYRKKELNENVKNKIAINISILSFLCKIEGI